MPLSISDFNTWASTHRSSAVATDGGALVAESTKLGIFDRIFRRGKVSQVRADVMADFTRALSSRYGASIAHQALFEAGLSATSQLKGSGIFKAVSIAKSLRASMLRSLESQDLKLGEAILRPGQIGDGNDAAQKFVNKFLRRRAVVVELLGEMPLSPADFADFQARANDITARLGAFLAREDIPERIPRDALAVEVNALIAAVNNKIGQARLLMEGQPLGEASQAKFRTLMHDTAIKTMEILRASTANPAAATAISAAIRQLRNNPEVRAQFEASVKIAKHVFSKVVAPFIADLVKTQLRLAQVRDFRVDLDDIKRKLDAGYRQTLNERPWNVIRKTISTTVGSRPVELTSTITPARHLGSTEQTKGPIASRYPQGTNGYMCHSADSRHAVNLHVSSLSVSDPGGAPKLVFCGVRHAVHSAWEIPNANGRAAANAKRAEEAVIAAFMAKYDLSTNPPPLPDAGDDGKTTVELNMTSVALLTPDKMRNKYRNGSDTDERSMLMDQAAAWETVQEKGVTFNYNGRTITVKPKIVKFNFGVNEGAVNIYSQIAPDRAGGWDASDRMNREAFAALDQEARSFIMDARQDLKTRNAVQKLLDQCRRVLMAKGERRDFHDAFKVAARIAVLSQLIGKVPCWNCKSGKDRTGEMDVECKFLSTLIARGEPIPEPGAALTKEQQALFRSIALNSGNLEVQKMNVGVSGFKTGGISSIAERLGGPQYRNIHRGGSDAVG